MTWTEDGGEIKTGLTDETVPFETIKLPPPFDKGIDISSITKDDLKKCIKYVESKFPWFRCAYRVGQARSDAMKSPGVTFKYDIMNGFWRSSIHELVRDFLKWYNTGIDPRAKNLELKAAKKAERALKRSVPSSKNKKKRKLSDVSIPSSSKDDADVSDEEDCDDDPPSPCGPRKNIPAVGVPVGVPLQTEEPTMGKWVPEVEDSYIRDARMITSCSSLMKHLKNHKDGDYVKNPYRKVAGEHTLKKTKETSKSHIKKVIRDWILSTPEGKRWLRACNLNEGEFTIDRVISRNGKSKGTNCVWNLVLMPARVNSFFGDDDEKKREYVGEKAWKIAMMSNEVFHEQAEVVFDFEAACAKKATAIMLSVDM